MSFSRAPRTSSAPSGEPCISPRPLSSARQSRWWCGRQSRRVSPEACAFSIALAWRPIVPINSVGAPSLRIQTAHLIDGSCKRERPINRDPVVVEQHDQFVELQVAGQRNGLLAQSLHQVTIRSKHVGVMIHQLATEYRCEMALRAAPFQPRFPVLVRAGRWSFPRRG